jgi:hypothetical protein
VLEDLGGESDGSLDLEVSVLGSVDEITTDCLLVYRPNTRSLQLTLFQRLDVLGGEGDPDLVGLGSSLCSGLV